MTPLRPNLRSVSTEAPAESPSSVASPILTLDDAYRRYSRYVAAIALRLLGRDSEVDDVVQDVFLAAMSGLGMLRDPEAARPWLATVTVRMTRRRLRLRRLRQFVGFDVAEDVNLALHGNAEATVLWRRIYLLLDEVGVSERLAWTLRHLEGMDLAQVAQTCGCSLATAKRRIAAAHVAVQRGLG